jgi:hypothetical protein
VSAVQRIRPQAVSADATYGRAGPLSPLELQLRRVDTRAAFLAHELRKLGELVDEGARMSSDQGQAFLRQLEGVHEAHLRILVVHGWVP